MADYNKSVNFAVKDTLVSGDPNKIVSGAEIDNEFNNISSMSSTKADKAPAPTANNIAILTSNGSVQDGGINLSHLQTAIYNAIYPVGSIYINATNNTNPATLLGFGTWVAFGAGRVPVGFDGSDSLFNAAEKTGGSKDAVLVSHNHTFSGTTNTTGAHTHNLQRGQASGVTSGCDGDGIGVQGARVGGCSDLPNGARSNGNHSHTFSGTTSTQGESGTNKNVQPYITVYMWKRTA